MSMKYFINSVLTALTVIILSSQVHSQVAERWVKRLDNSNRDDYATSVDADNSGNVYVTGYTLNGSLGDFITFKCSPSGDTLWSRKYDGTGLGDDRAYKVKVDNSGNVIVAGYSLGSGTGMDYVTIKYNASGVEQWVRRYNGPGNSNDYAVSMVLDDFGNIYVTGYSAGNGTSDDYATLKYNSSGALQWLRRYNGTGNGIDHARALDVDSLGNVYVTGRSASVGTGVSDFATIKYNAAGDSVWVKKYNGPGNGADSANSVSAGINGNVFITGNSFGVSSGSSDYATIKYNSSGDSVWVKRYNGPPGNNTDRATAVVSDKSGNCFVTGISVGSGTGNDFATLKYSSNGSQLWLNRFSTDGNNNDEARAMVIDQWGDIYITGVSNGHDFRTIKYNTNGDSLWNRTYFANSVDNAFSLEVDNVRNVFVVGDQDNAFDEPDIQLIKYEQSQALYLNILIEGFYNPISELLVKDTIRCYLRNITTPYSVVDSEKVFIDSLGNGIFNFFRANNVSQYYLVARHRNSIETWSKFPVSFPSFTLHYDFTTSPNKAFGNNLVLKSSEYCVFSGDVNQDGSVEATDLLLIDNDALLSTGGYVRTDVNGDFFVDGTDLLIADNNAFRFVSVIRP